MREYFIARNPAIQNLQQFFKFGNIKIVEIYFILNNSGPFGGVR